MTKKRNIQISTWLDYRFGKQHTEFNFGESVTVPGESMSIHEMLRRHGSGLIDSSAYRTGHYDDDPDYDDIDMNQVKDLDLFEKEEILRDSILQESGVAENKKSKAKPEAKQAPAQQVEEKADDEVETSDTP